MPQDLFNTQELSPHIEEELPLKEQLLPLRDKDLPPIIREVVSNAPANRKLPSFVACLAPLCALATRIRLHYYYDGQRTSALLLQVVIEGPQSIGKQFAADIEHLLMDNTLKAHDEKQRRLEQDYREKKNARAQNEKIGELPKTTIRVIPATISKTVLVRRADYYERNLGDVLTFWMFAEELAQVTDAGKQGYSNLRTIMRTAYDFGSTFGMDFASDNSYSAIVDINICSMFCATPSALDDYMDKSFAGAALSAPAKVFKCGLLLFLGFVNDATTFAESNGGGGCSQSDLPWRDRDEEDAAYMRRCMFCAQKMMKPKGGYKVKKGGGLSLH